VLWGQDQLRGYSVNTNCEARAPMHRRDATASLEPTQRLRTRGYAAQDAVHLFMARQTKPRTLQSACQSSIAFYQQCIFSENNEAPPAQGKR